MPKMQIDTAKARTTASEIEKTIKSIDASMHEMQSLAKNIVDKGIHTEWADKLLANLNKYMDQDLADALAEMKLSAQNIYIAAEQTEAYSRESEGSINSERV